MRTSILLTLLLLAAILATPLTAADYVSVRGRQILDPSGQPLQLRGINLGNWLVPEGYMFRLDAASSPRLLRQLTSELLGPDGSQDFWKKFGEVYITREDIQFLRKCGFNTVRLPFSHRGFFREDDESWTDRGFEPIDRAIAWCREAGLWVILDMHCAPGGQTGDNIDDSWGYPWLYESEPSQRRTIEIWRRMAARYRKETVVIGYDLLNEPIAHFFDTARLNPLLEPLFKKITAAIRAEDTDHLVILEGAQWASKFEPFGSPFDPKLIYSFHKYWTEPGQTAVQEYLDYAARHNVPLLMGESGENSDDWIGKFRETLDRNQIHWTFWPYKKLDATSCPASIVKPEHWDEIVAYAKAPRNSFEQVRKAREAAPHAREALAAFLENCRFEKLRVNPSYLRALGL